MASIKKSSGFTLIEMVVVVAIVGILASVAWSFYESETLRKNRYEAIASLTTAAQELERVHSDFGSYASSAIPSNSKRGNYAISVTNPNTCGGVQGCYLVTATTQGAQQADKKCTTFTLDNLGLKKSYDDSNTATTSCWSQ